MEAPANEIVTQSHSQETLRRVKENDETLKALWIGGTVRKSRHNNQPTIMVHIQHGEFMVRDRDGVFNPSDNSEFTSLGEYIAENTHLTRLVHVEGLVGLDVECLRRNSSIHKLSLTCDGHDISDVVTRDILQVYQEKGNLTRLYIQNTNLQNGGVDVLVNTLRSCTNLKSIILDTCGITGEQMLAIAEAIICHNMLKDLGLPRNHIGNIGCWAIANLLDGANCNMQRLNFSGNNIGNEGATSIANSLAKNTKLQKIILYNNPIDQSVVEESFCKVLCTTTTINSTFSSNHILKELNPRGSQLLESLLMLNNGTNKSHVAIKKILKYHPNIDMEPMFEWDAEEGEQNLKALPYVASWFERAGAAVGGDSSRYESDTNDDECYNIERRKLSAFFQFAKAMPLLFEGLTTIDTDECGRSCNKRKRIDG